MEYNELLAKYLDSVNQNNTLLEKQNELLNTISELNLTISALNKTIEKLQSEKDDHDKSINTINAQLKKLEKRINMNSTNSSCPPSKDNDKTKAKRRTKSLRKKSDKSQGGQAGHKGETVEISSTPDILDVNLPSKCPNCGHEFNENEINKVRKQIFDLKMEKLVTEFVRGKATCPSCGAVIETKFPDNVINPVNYSTDLVSYISYLSNYGMVSMQRIKEMLHEFANFDLSTGTIAAYNLKMGLKLQPIKEAMMKAIYRYDIWHVDETGIYVNGKRLWLHTIVAGSYHLLFVHEKRGIEALKEIGLIEKFRGKLVHDNWASYQKFENCDHIQCMIHVERTLVSIYEEFQETECKELLDYIRQIYIQREDAMNSGVKMFDDEIVLKIEENISEILERWRTNHLKKYPMENTTKKPGRKARDEAIKMIDRLTSPETRGQYFEWIHDFAIPYTNNRAESSFRLQKVKMNVAGTFRSIEGAQSSCDLLAFIKTVRELGLEVKDSLNKILHGQYDFVIAES